MGQKMSDGVIRETSYPPLSELQKGKLLGTRLRSVEVNGQPGSMVFNSGGGLINVMSLDIADGRIQSIRSVVNPEKLRHLGPLSDRTRLPHRSG
jgi:RNA polymerase sigma-70 factor (ECF subfamily)